MHFQLAVVFMLVPLIVAAPTRNVNRQGSLFEYIESLDTTIDKATKPVDGSPGTLPVGNVKRQSEDPIGNLGPLAEPLKVVESLLPGVAKPAAAGKRQSEDPIGNLGPLAEPLKVVESLLPGVAKPAAAGKRQSPHSELNLASLAEPFEKIEGLLSGDLTKPAPGKRQDIPDLRLLNLPAAKALGALAGLEVGNEKRDAPTDIVGELANTLKPVTGDITKPTAGKRQSPTDNLGTLAKPLEKVGTLAEPLEALLSGGLTKPEAGKRDLVDGLEIADKVQDEVADKFSDPTKIV
ncbi:hypothetical protein V492_00459 [Pseudogymnoascus sp. VKM F-4246]|nr:hypothetical protein V492_00459 [Pseudogymnoascus sp. VKM F-4246]